MNSYNGFSGKQREANLRAMNRALASGALAPAQGPCELCGDPEVAVEYHGEDYSEPYLWTAPACYVLCRNCHRDKVHKRHSNPLLWQVFKAHVRRGGYARETSLPRVHKELSRYREALKRGEPMCLEQMRERPLRGDEWWELLECGPHLQEQPANATTSTSNPREAKHPMRHTTSSSSRPSRPGTDAQWRERPESAREVLENLYPDPSVRRACEDVLAEAIRCAAAQAPLGHWSVTLMADCIRLNTGTVEAVALERNTVRILLDAEVVPWFPSDSLLKPRDAHYASSRTECWAAVVDARNLPAAMDRARKGMQSHIEANVKSKCRWRSSHSPGVLRHLGLEFDA